MSSGVSAPPTAPITHEACKSVGIRCFITSTVGQVFHGEFKTRAEDFVVTEIDENGQRASMEPGESPPVIQGGDKEVVFPDTQKGANTKKTTAPDAPATPTPEMFWNKVTEAISSRASLSRELGGEENLTKLEAFAEIVRARILGGNVDLGDLLPAPPESCTFSVPCDPLDRAGRKLVHNAVTMTYPFLSTKIVQGVATTPSIADLVVSANELLDPLCSILPTRDDVLKLYKFIADTRRHREQRSFRLFLQPLDDKDSRRKFHHFFQEKLKWARTSTSKKNEPIVSFFRKVGKQGKRWGKKRKVPGLPSSGADDSPFAETALADTFTRVVVRKESIDQGEAIHSIAKLLNVAPSQIGFAGTKDKVSISYQYMTVKNMTVHEIKRRMGRHVAKHRFLEAAQRKIEVGDSSTQAGRHLGLGDLRGNHFAIVLRNVTPQLGKGVLQDTARAVTEFGFVNYFGLQRLGKFCAPGSPRPFQIGAAMLRGDWERAIALSLAPRIGEGDGATAAKVFYRATKDAKETLRRLPSHMRHETLILQGLRRFGDDNPQKVFQTLPYKLRTMYVHSLQSYIWNHMASRRWEFHVGNSDAGAAPTLAIGDMVCERGQGGRRRNNVYHTITHENCRKMREAYSARDIVIPSVGWTTRAYLEQNDLYRPVIEELLQRHEMTWDMFSPKADQQECRIKGAYRHFLGFPEHLTVSESEAPPGLGLSLEFAFSLKSSMYATVCLREIMKNDMIMACDARFQDWNEHLAALEHSSSTGTAKKEETSKID